MEKLLTKKSVHNFRAIFSSSILIQVVKMMRGYVVAGILSPVHYGIIQSLAIFQTYLPLLQSGYNQSVEQEIPRVLAGNNTQKITKIFSNGVLWSLLSGVVACVLFLAILILKPRSSDEWFIWMSYLPIILLFSLSNMLEIFYVASARITQLSILRVISSFVFIGLIVLVFLFNYKGQVISLSVQYIVLTVLLFKTLNQKTDLSLFNLRYILKHIKKGYGIVMSQYLFFLLLSLDRLYMATIAGPSEYASYALGITFFRLGMQVPENMNVVAYRFLNLTEGKLNNVREFNLLLYLLALVLMALATGILLLAKPFFTILLSKYVNAAVYTHYFAFALVFSGLSMLLIHYFYSVQKAKTVATSLVTSMVVMAALLAVNHFWWDKTSVVPIAFVLVQVMLFVVLAIKYSVQNAKLQNWNLSFKRIFSVVVTCMLFTTVALLTIADSMFWLRYTLGIMSETVLAVQLYKMVLKYKNR